MTTGIWIRDKTLDKNVVSAEGCVEDITDVKIRFKIFQHQDWWLDKGFNLGDDFYLWLENLADNTNMHIPRNRYDSTYYIGFYENEKVRIRIKINRNIERDSDSHWLKKWGGKLQKPLGTPTVSTLAKQNQQA